MPTAVETHLLTKRFRRLDGLCDLLTYPWRAPDRVVVDAVSLTIREGELFGLLGPNGAGKTTLIRMLSTALLPSSGHATVAGYDIVAQPGRVRGTIAVVGSDERSFYGRLSARANLEFFAALSGVPAARTRARIAELLDHVGLAASADRPVRTYSCGMRQRLGIARALLRDAHVLFLDEPTRSLDPVGALDVRRLIRDYLVGEMGRTVLLATHSLPEAEALCDRLALVQGGRVIAQGSVADLGEKLTPGVRCELRLARIPAGLAARLHCLPGVLAVEVADDEPAPSVLRLTLADEGPVLASVLLHAVARGAEVHGCTTRRASLEDIYLSKLAPAGAAAEAVPC